MSASLKRDLTFSAVSAGALIAGVTATLGAQFVMLAIVMLVLGFVWTWSRVAHHPLQSRLATAILAGFAGVVVAMVAVIGIGLVFTVLVIASAAVVAAVVDRSVAYG